MQIVLFGGSFNPPHVAHVLAAAYALVTERVDKVLVVPVFSHAFDKGLAPFEDRLTMCRLAMQCFRDVEVSDVEQNLGSPSRTLRTIQHLLGEHPDWSLRLLVGADVLSDAHKWLAFEEVVRLAPPIVLGRVGTVHPDAPPPVLPDISSTRLRSLLRNVGDPAAGDELRRWLPRDVHEYITAHGLYR